MIFFTVYRNILHFTLLKTQYLTEINVKKIIAIYCKLRKQSFAVTI